MGSLFVRFEMLIGIKLLVCRLLWVIGLLTGLQVSLFIGWYWLMAVVCWLSLCVGNMASVGLIEAQGLIILGRDGRLYGLDYSGGEGLYVGCGKGEGLRHITFIIY